RAAGRAIERRSPSRRRLLSMMKRTLPCARAPKVSNLVIDERARRLTKTLGETQCLVARNLPDHLAARAIDDGDHHLAALAVDAELQSLIDTAQIRFDLLNRDLDLLGRRWRRFRLHGHGLRLTRGWRTRLRNRFWQGIDRHNRVSAEPSI